MRDALAGLAGLFSNHGFMPHGHCYLWRRDLVALHVGSDALIALSYTAIPFALAYFVRERRDLPFTWMFKLFGLFIVACGATHYMAIWTLWEPAYWLSGSVKLVTALASVPTALMLIRLVPHALALPSPEDLRRANAELSASQEELERTNRRLEATNAELEAFSYSVAHDLRAPLRAMGSFSQILQRSATDKLDEEEVDCLQEISLNADQMDKLVDGLLGLSRVTRYEPQQTRVNVTAMAQGIADTLAARHPEREVRVTVQPEMTAVADPDLLRALFENLLDNAWKFTREADPARIEVGASEQDGVTVYHVKDNGVGFDPAYAQRMFTAFQRFHSRAAFPGTGIGLATVRRIVHRHGGRIWAEGKVGHGATFRFTLQEAHPQPEVTA